MLTGIISVEKNINDLMELKNTAQELYEAYTSINSRTDQAKERISVTKDQLNEIKLEDKIREKRMKKNKQSLQEIWDYVKRPSLDLLCVPENDRKNGNKLKTQFRILPRRTSPIQQKFQKIQRTPLRYSMRNQHQDT